MPEWWEDPERRQATFDAVSREARRRRTIATIVAAGVAVFLLVAAWQMTHDSSGCVPVSDDPKTTQDQQCPDDYRDY